jgi:hypothetical protein
LAAGKIMGQRRKDTSGGKRITLLFSSPSSGAVCLPQLAFPNFSVIFNELRLFFR